MNAMKHVRVLSRFLLALVMVCVLTVPAFADQEGVLTGGSITIRNAVPQQVYSAYQILYLESYNKDAGAYAYKANSLWEDWLKTQTSYVHFDDQGYVTWVEGADPAAFAKAAQAAASGKTADATAVASNSTVSFTGLKLGYYLIDTTLGTLCSLDTTNPDMEITEKNAAPENCKTVLEDSTNTYGEKNDADIGQSITFQSTITAQKGAENYVFHDAMSQGLTYTGITGISLNSTAVDSSLYTISAPADDGDTFDIVFSQAFCDGLNTGDQIIITYTATVNSSAVIAGDGNPNTSKVSYGDSSNTKFTPDSQTRTYTWDLDILKYANGDETALLKDAEFVLLNSDRTQAAIITGGKLTGWTAVPDSNSVWPDGTVLVTDDQGRIEIDGLDADTYYLREIKAPDGYNKLKDDQQIIITGAVETDSGWTYTTILTKINNQSGTELPSTGGMGTTVFYTLGSVLAIGAAAALAVKKRTGNCNS